MTPNDYLLWGQLIDHLVFNGIIRDRAIPWASPVPYYGSPSRATVATVALRPSHGEFIDRANGELQGRQRRFHTLRSLGLRSWASVESTHVDRIDAMCTDYFLRRPYRIWHDRVAQVLEHTGFSYQNGSACHLPLIPYAFPQNIGRATPERDVRNTLSASGAIMGRVLRDAPIRLLILNGNGVLSRFEWLSDVAFREMDMPTWQLSGVGVHNSEGFAYQGIVDKIGGIDLGRAVAVVGFNHSLLSRYMDVRVRNAIGQWVGQIAATLPPNPTMSI